jgi:hypothetical protein
MRFSEIDEPARELFRAEDPTGVWAYADYPVQAHFRRQSQQQLTAKLAMVQDIPYRVSECH